MTSGIDMPFGKWLKQRRKATGLTQVELARCVGCSVRTIVQVELGERRPSRQIAELMARCVNIPTEETAAFVAYARGIPQTAAPDSWHTPATWQLAQKTPNNLPASPTAFVGREKEVATAATLLRSPEVRLVTMTGAPGIGKTRLSLQVARALLEDVLFGSTDANPNRAFRDGIYFFPLETVREPELIAPTIARVLKVKEAPGDPILEQLKEALRVKRMLLILDNFEQIIDGAPVISELITASPGLKVLVTSREVLHLYGEYEFRVNPLAVPAPEEKEVVSVMKYESVRLFAQRAAAARLEFAINNHNAEAVAKMCAHLEGLPLAIELAAAHIRDLSPENILARLYSNDDVLAGGPQDRPARQRTLKGAIDWSYELLNPAAQKLFRCLSVFVGGFTREAAAYIIEHDEESTEDISQSITELANKSLLQETGAGQLSRWRLLEPIRESAAERLAQAAEEEDARSKHASYYLTLAETAEPQLKGGQQRDWLQRLDADYNNMRAAIDWWLQHDDVERVLRLSSALWRYWLIRGYLTEGREWLSKALDLAERKEAPHTIALADALNGAGNLAYTAGDFARALALHNANLKTRTELNDRQGMAGALNNLAAVWRDQGDYEQASNYFQASLDLKRALGDRISSASTMNNLGIVKQRQSYYEAALALYEESLQIWREAGDQYGIATALSNLGVVHAYRGDYRLARAFQDESLVIRRTLGDKLGIAISLGSIASLAYTLGDYEEAYKLHEENLDMRREQGDKPGIAASLYGLGQITRRQNKVEQARAYINESLAISYETGNKQGIAECFAELAGIIADEAQASERDRRAKLKKAARLSGAAEALFEATGSHLYPKDNSEYRRIVDSAARLLGNEAWEQKQAEGRKMALVDAVTFALSI